MAKAKVPSSMQQQAFVNNLTDHLRDIGKEKELKLLDEIVQIALDAELTLTAQDK